MSDIAPLTVNLAEQQLDHLPIGICVVDHDLNVLQWNQTLAQWTGLSTETAIGSNLLELYPHLNSARFLQRMKNVFERKQAALFAPSVSHPFLPISLDEDDDDMMLHKTTIAPLGDQNQYAQIILTDVTNQYKQVQALRNKKEQHRRSQQDAESANRAKSEFLANMSHEIRTPMTAILGFNDILLDNVTEPDDIDAARTVKKNGEYLITLINDILDLAKIESGKLDMERTGCSPQQIVADVVALMGVRATAKNLRLETQFVGDIPETIQSDPTRLRQILINIVGNAIKFTETGSVKIVARLLNAPDEEPKLHFDVTDTGIGIAEENIEKLFLSFTQADGSTTRKFGGTGLGLTISKRLVELLGGTISIASTVGKGSTFSLTVSTGPLDDVRLTHNAVEAAGVTETSAEIDKKQGPLDNYRILLAEDGPDNQRLIGFILKKAGVEVTLADNGQIALELATAAKSEGRPFDVILMDMQMPVLDGYEATRRLRAEGYTLPIVALTAHAMASDRQKCLNAGCDDYATKPIDRKKLIQTVASYAKQARVAEEAAPSSSGA